MTARVLRPGDVVAECAHFPEDPNEPVRIHYVTRTGPDGEELPAIIHWREHDDAPLERIECFWMLICLACDALPIKSVELVRVAPWDGDEVTLNDEAPS